MSEFRLNVQQESLMIIGLTHALQIISVFGIFEYDDKPFMRI